MSDLTPCNYCNLERIKRKHPDKMVLLKATNDRIWLDNAATGAKTLLPEMIAVTVEGRREALMDTIPSRCAC